MNLRKKALGLLESANTRTAFPVWAFVEIAMAIAYALIGYVDQFTCWGDDD